MEPNKCDKDAALVYAKALFEQLSPSDQIKILDLLKSLLSAR